MKTRELKLQAGETVPFPLVPFLLAEAMYDDESTQAVAREEVRAELLKMVDSGTLVVRDPLSLEPLSPSLDDVAVYGVLTVDDLQRVLSSKGVSLNIRGVIRISEHHRRISVEEAITLVVDAVDFENRVGKDGLTELELLVSRIGNEFAELCARTDIAPRLPSHPTEEYSVDHPEAADFVITVDEFERYAAEYGIFVELIDWVPSAQIEGGVGVPKQRSQARMEAIVAQLRSMGYEPLALPRNSAGKRGVKAETKAALGNKGIWAGTTVFNRAWEHLMKNQTIAYRK